jgi:hypothetical protein
MTFYKNIFMVTLLFGLAANAKVTIENQWTETGNLSETTVYEKSGMSLTVLEGKTSRKRDIASTNYQAEISKSLETRKSTLEMLGYDDWSAKNIEFAESKNSKIVRITGKYKKDNADFEFTEWQVYSGLKYTSFQLENKVDDPNSVAEISYLNKLSESLK